MSYGESVTYALVCPISKKVRYVGHTINIETRFLQHKASAKSCRNENMNLSDWIRLLGIYGHSPKLKILCKGNKEYQYIRDFQKENQLYNKPYSKGIESIEGFKIYEKCFNDFYNYFRRQKNKTKIKL